MINKIIFIYDHFVSLKQINRINYKMFYRINFGLTCYYKNFLNTTISWLNDGLFILT